MVSAELGGCYRRVLWAGWITVAGLIVLAALSWAGAVYQPLGNARILLFFSLALPAVFYVRAINAAEMVPIRVIVLFGAAFALIGFCTLPFDSTDVFYYIAQGWQQSQYEHNPYSHVLRDVPNHTQDPMIYTPWNAQNLNPWLDLPFPYGFLFAAVVRLIAGLGQGDFWLTLSLFGMLNLGAHALVGWLIWRVSHLMRFGSPKKALFLYTWNPFVLAHSMGDLHNDVLVGLFVVLALYCVARRRPEWVLAALVAGGLIKYIALALLPFAALSVFRLFGFRKLVFSVAMAATVAIVISAPYLVEAPHFKVSLITAQMTESTGSFHSFMVGLLRMTGITMDRFPGLTAALLIALQAALWLAFAVFAAYEVRGALRKSISLDRIVMRWTRVLAFILFFSSSQLYAWYIGMLLPLAVLAHESWVGRAVVAASAAHLFGFTELKAKRIGYFIFCTVAPFVVTLLAARRNRPGLHGVGQRHVPQAAIALGTRFTTSRIG